MVNHQRARSSTIAFDPPTGWGLLRRPREIPGTLVLVLTLAVRAAAQAPDIILIETDDQPWHTLQFMPNVQRLIGDQGVTFRRYYVSTSLCGPSRATTLSGQHSHHNGVTRNAAAAAHFDATTSLATWLDAAGYRTALVGKYLNDYGVGVFPGVFPAVPPGWDYWRGMKGGGYFNFDISVDGVVEQHRGRTSDQYSTNVLRDYAVDFLQSSSTETPVFLFFTPFASHRIWTPDPVDLQAFDGLPFLARANYNETDVTDKPVWIRTLPLAQDQQIRLEGEKIAEVLQAVDRAVAAIVAAAEARGRPLYILFTSDNGWALGSHRWTKKLCVYDECSREPLLVRGPGIPAGVAIQKTKLASNVDLAPTIAELAGATPSLNVDGISLVPLLKDPDLPWTRDLLLENLGPQAKYWSVRTADGWEYTEYPQTQEFELYDLNADPSALQSLHADSAFGAKRAELAAKLAPMKH